MLQTIMLALILVASTDAARTLRRSSRNQYTGSVGLSWWWRLRNWMTFRRYQ